MVDVQEVLAYVDKIVFSKTNKHLNDAQTGVILGTLQHQKLSDIAQAINVSEGRIKEVACELWKSLSEHFGEEVNKSNLASVFLRKGVVNEPVINIFGAIGSGNTLSSVRSPISNLSFFNCDFFDSVSNKDIDRSELKLQVLYYLRQIGFTNEQIAAALELSVEAIEEMTRTPS